MTYKPEVDGLRAITILLIMMVHMQLGSHGGFVAVDVFFVISGFLITSIILGAVEKDKFSFLDFFGRRLFRLYPAILIMMAVILVIALLITSPYYMYMVGRSGRYALASLANIYFGQHLDYFAAEAKSQIFLHTWTLGVEWQFYIAWPFITWACLKVSRRFYIAVIIFLTIASVFASEWAAHNNPTAAYYLMPYRAFDLTGGALMAFFYNRKPSPAIGALMMYGGLGILLLLSFFLYTPETPYPGFAGFVPTVASIMCIYGGQSVSKWNILATRPLVYIGKTSYSIYLYHWPILLLYTNFFMRDLHLAERIMMVVVSIVVGAISYELVEKRITWRKLKNKKLGIITLFALLFALIGIYQYTYKTKSLLAWRSPSNELISQEYFKWGGENYANHLLIIGDQTAQPMVVMAGDSTTGNLAIGMKETGEKENFSVYIANSPGCQISIIDKDVSATPLCQSVSQQAIDTAKEKQLPLVLTQAWWVGANQHDPTTDASLHQDHPAGLFEFIEANLNDIHQRIGGQPLILVSGIPFDGTAGTAKDCLTRPDILPRLCEKQLQDYTLEQSASAELNRHLKAYAQAHDNVFYIEMGDVLCPDGICSVTEQAKTYTDKIHLSVYGSQVAAPFIYEKIEQILSNLAEASSAQEPQK